MTIALGIMCYFIEEVTGLAFALFLIIGNFILLLIFWRGPQVFSRKVRVQLVIVATLIVLLSSLLSVIYAYYVALLVFFVLNVLFSFFLSKQVLLEWEEKKLEEERNIVEEHNKDLPEQKLKSNLTQNVPTSFARKSDSFHQEKELVISSVEEKSAEEPVEQKDEISGSVFESEQSDDDLLDFYDSRTRHLLKNSEESPDIEDESISLLPRALREEEDEREDSMPLRIPYEDKSDDHKLDRLEERLYEKRSKLFEQLENEVKDD
jgi:Ca2+/Na+ antiporter